MPSESSDDGSKTHRKWVELLSKVRHSFCRKEVEKCLNILRKIVANRPETISLGFAGVTFSADLSATTEMKPSCTRIVKVYFAEAASVNCCSVTSSHSLIVALEANRLHDSFFDNNAGTGKTHMPNL